MRLICGKSYRQDTRYKIQDTRYKIQDTRYKDELNVKIKGFMFFSFCSILKI